MFVWKKQLDGKTQNTNYTVDELVKIRKLFVGRGKNDYNMDFTKESVSSVDGNQITLDPLVEGYSKHTGLMSYVHESGKKMFVSDGNVIVYDRDRTSENQRDTGRTIQKLISDGDLFVCDEILESTASYKKAAYDPKTQKWGGGGKRNKSRKPKRRNSRSNRRKTLNKSKK